MTARPGWRETFLERDFPSLGLALSWNVVVSSPTQSADRAFSPISPLEDATAERFIGPLLEWQESSNRSLRHGLGFRPLSRSFRLIGKAEWEEPLPRGRAGNMEIGRREGEAHKEGKGIHTASFWGSVIACGCLSPQHAGNTAFYPVFPLTESIANTFC